MVLFKDKEVELEYYEDSESLGLTTYDEDGNFEHFIDFSKEEMKKIHTLIGGILEK